MLNSPHLLVARDKLSFLLLNALAPSRSSVGTTQTTGRAAHEPVRKAAIIALAPILRLHARFGAVIVSLRTRAPVAPCPLPVAFLDRPCCLRGESLVPSVYAGVAR